MISVYRNTANNHDFSGQKAIDGIYEPKDENEYFDSLAHTFAEISPWLQADLINQYCINAVKIWNRNERLQPHLSLYKGKLILQSHINKSHINSFYMNRSHINGSHINTSHINSSHIDSSHIISSQHKYLSSDKFKQLIYMSKVPLMNN